MSALAPVGNASQADSPSRQVDSLFSDGGLISTREDLEIGIETGGLDSSPVALLLCDGERRSGSQRRRVEMEAKGGRLTERLTEDDVLSNW